MKKILYITAFPPCRQTAGQNYSRLLINELADTHYIEVIYFGYKSHEFEIYKSNIVKYYVKNNSFRKFINIFKLPFLHPFFISRFRISLLFYIWKNSANYDVLYFDFSQVFIYSLFIRHKRKIMMAHDIIIQKYKRDKNNILTSISNFFIKKTEKLLFESATEIYCFSRKDADLIKKYYNIDAVSVPFYIENAIINANYKDKHISDYFVFYGAWNRVENSEGLFWFLTSVFPYLNDVKIKIIGPKLPLRIEKIISNINNINYLGFVENPYDYIIESRGLIAPIFKGAGVKVKVIETLATGTPVIGTDVAWEGIISKNFFLANSAKEFIDTINTLKTIEITDKVKYRDIFLLEYNVNKFINYL